MAGPHTRRPADGQTAGRSPLSLISTAEAGLPEQLAGSVDGHLAEFAAHMREGLLAASTAVGLEVMAELMDAKSSRSPAPRAAMTPTASPTSTAPRPAR